MDYEAVSAHWSVMKPIYLQVTAAIAAGLGLSASAACAKQPATQPQQQTAAPDAMSWNDAPQTKGDWVYRETGGESFAEFHSPAREMLFQMNCTADRQIFIAAASSTLQEGTITIRTETQARTLGAAAREGWRVAAIRPSDPLLDAMAITKGRFAVEMAGQPSLYLPAWAEVTRVIEDCR